MWVTLASPEKEMLRRSRLICTRLETATFLEGSYSRSASLWQTMNSILSRAWNKRVTFTNTPRYSKIVITVSFIKSINWIRLNYFRIACSIQFFAIEMFLIMIEELTIHLFIFQLWYSISSKKFLFHNLNLAPTLSGQLPCPMG